jgi:putative flavoprotein involved in K+ transport
MHTEVVVIGAGQAGLAVSNLLTGAGVGHVVLERGRTGERWISQRWDSLRLLSPNWMTRLPGWRYRGSDPDGFMTAGEVAGYLQSYASSFGAPVVHDAGVRSVVRAGGGYRVTSDAGSWTAGAVVLATGYCHHSSVPDIAGRLHPSVLQLTPDQYRNPSDVPDGGVLIVGGSATGAQLADELAAAGREVVLAVGRHTRLPRRYRGRDIFWWLDSMGTLDRPSGIRADRPSTPSLQIVGSPDGREVDLPSLAERGVRPAGRVTAVGGRGVSLADDLPLTTAAADARLTELLDRIDRHAAVTGLHREVGAVDRPRPSAVLRTDVPIALDLRAAGIRSVLWATGYRRSYPWLHVPVLDARGEIVHTAGRTPAPGLMVIGQYCQTRRSSSTLDGVRFDAATVVEHLTTTVLGRTTASRRAS